MVNEDGSSYIRTEGSDKGAWENSHYHKQVHELYIVERGWIVYAELNDRGQAAFTYLSKGGTIDVKPITIHNIYMPAFAVIHVVKYTGGSTLKPDWFASPELDDVTKGISEDKLLQSLNKDR
ncbi:hypothetical protein JOC55_005824 [Paenibacillus sacheonensis]|nr:hypothetical protein [Paenibacillus sacheonensis]